MEVLKQSLATLIAESFEKAKMDSIRFKVMTEVCPLPMWINDPNGELLYVNQAFTYLTGFVLEDLQGKSFIGLSLEEEKRIQQSWSKYLVSPDKNSRAWIEDVNLHKKDETTVTVMMKAVKVPRDGYIGFMIPKDSPLSTIEGMIH